MSVFMFRAAFYCSDCAGDLPQPEPLTMEQIEAGMDSLWDSDSVAIEYPDAGEADSPQHCDRCHVLLDCTLTPEGLEYVCEALSEADGDPDVLAEWDWVWGDQL